MPVLPWERPPVKVDLQIRTTAPSLADRVGSPAVPVKRALPFFKSRSGEYVHRVRRATMYYRDGEYSHTAVTLWCGGNGFPGKKGTLMDVPPNASVFCATCEGRAIGAGLDGNRDVRGRAIMFKPRV